jgi:hypothetical protein
VPGETDSDAPGLPPSHEMIHSEPSRVFANRI